MMDEHLGNINGIWFHNLKIWSTDLVLLMVRICLSPFRIMTSTSPQFLRSSLCIYTPMFMNP